MLLLSVGWASLSLALTKPAGVESSWVWKPRLLCCTKIVLHPLVMHPDCYSRFSLVCPKKSPLIFALTDWNKSSGPLLSTSWWLPAAEYPVPLFSPEIIESMKWFGLEGPLKTIQFQRPSHGQAHLLLDRLLRSPCSLAMNISRDGAGIILLSHLNIISAVRADLEEGIALGSSGEFPSGPGGFLGFSACSCGQETLTCPGCCIHAAKLLINFLWKKIFHVL